ncbi:MAG: NAD(P)/FAD-dependent oxidoreductase [Ktedonobacteraceae bacterium]
MKDIPDVGTQTAKERQGGLQSVAPMHEVLPAVKPRVVIVGSGFGGLQAAKALHDAPVQVTVLDRNNHHLFQPLLYQVATAVLSPADISAPIRSALSKQANAEVLLGEVTGVDVEAQRVFLHEQAIPYDYLILATGAHDSYFGHDDWAAYAPGLKSIVQAIDIRRKILLAFERAERETDPEKRQALLTFVLVGAGPTGVEMAGAIGGLAHKTLVSDFRHINPKEARIVLVEALPRILPAFDEHLAEKARKALNHLGVEVRTSSPVQTIDSEGVMVAGQRIASKTVIWTAGVAASPAGQWLAAETDRAGRVKVGSDATVPGHSNIFVIGDTSSFTQDGKPLPGIAPVAMQQGRYVASVITDRVAGKPHPEAFHYVEKGNMAVVGRFYGIVSIKKLRFAGLLAWFVWLVLHLMFLIGYRNRLVVAFQWAVYFTTFRRGARLITFEDASDSS